MRDCGICLLYSPLREHFPDLSSMPTVECFMQCCSAPRGGGCRRPRGAAAVAVGARNTHTIWYYPLACGTRRLIFPCLLLVLQLGVGLAKAGFYAGAQPAAAPTKVCATHSSGLKCPNNFKGSRKASSGIPQIEV